MKTKKEILKELEDNYVKVPEDLDWNELRSFYKDRMEEIENMKKIKTQDDLTDLDIQLNFYHGTYDPNDPVYDIFKNDRKLTLDEIREKLKPEIIDLIEILKKKSRMNDGEMKELYSLYNKFYKRSDGPRNQNVGKVLDSMKKLCNRWNVK